LATVPVAYRSSAEGSSLAADFWATSNMLLPASIAVSSALMDFGRPTNSGITMCGNTTTSRNGSRGRLRMSTPDSKSVIFGHLSINAQGIGGAFLHILQLRDASA